MKITQSWMFSSTWKLFPVFFLNGKRVSVAKGHELVTQGCLIAPPELQKWFNENGYN